MAVNASELDFGGLRVTCITTKPFRQTYDGRRNRERDENRRERDERVGSPPVCATGRGAVHFQSEFMQVLCVACYETRSIACVVWTLMVLLYLLEEKRHM